MSFYLEKTQKFAFWAGGANLNLMCKFLSNIVFSLKFSRSRCITLFQNYWKKHKNIRGANLIWCANFFTTSLTFEFLPGKNTKIPILGRGANLNLMCKCFRNIVFSLKFSRGITLFQNYWKISVIWILRRP